ncbi:MAG: 4Fe-4S dicluster domain-containing protein [Oscillospiraceae bacterium]|jgi:Fe-S-cluster-containing dehydrogenase component
MARYGFVFNIERCNGCCSCFLACKDEYTGNDYPPTAAATCEGVNLIRVNEVEYGTGSKVKVDYIPIPCQNCEDAPCLNRFPDQVYRRDDGIIIIDPEKARGNRELVSACPYGAIAWNEQSQLPQKCTMCAHMLDAGEKVTRCSECCPNGALLFGDLDDPTSEISIYIKEHAGELEKFRPEYGTNPAVYYRHLPKPFIAGEVVCGDDDSCCKGAKVTVICEESGQVMETVTDFFGDFEFRFLPLNKTFTIKVEAEGYKTAEIKTRTNAAVNLGEIILEKA